MKELIMEGASVPSHLEVTLLSDEEMMAITGGAGPLAVAGALIVGGAGAFAVGVVVGVGVYLLVRAMH